LSIRLFICLSIRMSICLSIRLFICLSVHPSVYPFIKVSVYSSGCLYILQMSVYFSVQLSVFLFNRLSFQLSVLLLIRLYICSCTCICLSVCWFNHVCISLQLSVCLSIHFICLCVQLSNGRITCVPVSTPVCVSIHSFVFLSLCLFCLSVFLYIHLPVYLCVCPSVYLKIKLNNVDQNLDIVVIIRKIRAKIFLDNGLDMQLENFKGCSYENKAWQSLTLILKNVFLL
jgi:hypothetical protein